MRTMTEEVAIGKVVAADWSNDGRTLRVHRQAEAGILTTTYEWDERPSEEIVQAALEERPDKAYDGQEGQGHRVARHRLPFGLTLYTHHDWGPPLWRLPRLRVRIDRERVTVDVGWIYHCYGLTLARTPGHGS